MLAKFFVVVAGSTIAMSAFAVDPNLVKQSIPLKDGSTVYVFSDGKMGMEDKFGHTAHMKPGAPMETKDGKKIIMIGNEVFRVEPLLPYRRAGQSSD